MEERKFEFTESLKDYFYKYILKEAECWDSGIYHGEDEKMLKEYWHGGYENDVFLYRAVCWGYEDNLEDTEEAEFKYFQTGLEITFKTHPFEFWYMNQDITNDELKNIFEKCYQSIVRDKNATN